MTDMAIAQPATAPTGLRTTIIETLIDVAEGMGATLHHPLSDDMVLLESGLDSLGFAILVARLEEELGWDPFTLSDSPYYPTRLGEFVAFYEANQP
ncbi:acyl carrier protein [uncultured Sphingomonas sp.]|uniref:acyl carrier protein n=1 Tax=uncultured Sphingomonas sp. TaxID=158754 RepID=UPI0025F0B680|nr:acyl carrier protein [uncultured Sphingomonas sp.]